MISLAVSADDHNQNDLIEVAKKIKDEKLYITVLILQGQDVATLLNSQTFGYPYFFVGTDAWFDEGEIAAAKLSSNNEYLHNSVGTIPFNPTMFTEDEYVKYGFHGGNKTIYQISQIINAFIMNDIRANTDISIATTIMPYAFDSMLSLAHALHIYDQEIELLSSIFRNCTEGGLEELTQALHEILVNMEPVIGATV